VLTVAALTPEVEGVREVALSLPRVVGRDGAGEALSPALDDGERAALKRSAEIVGAAAAEVGF
jgi:L-lactate dehydrogenase